MRATRESWNILPAPDRREPLEINRQFNAVEAEQIEHGLIPEAMEDKWFIYFEDEWLRFHRSWTGAFIYALRLDRSPGGGVRVVEAWANRDPEQHKGTDAGYDRRLLHFLVDAFLLKRSDVKFPMPAGMKDAVDGVVQHHYVGRGYPEVEDEGT